MRPFSRVIVLRGDLYSDTGYGRATRALGSILATHATQIFGVSLHEHRDRRQNTFAFPVVTDTELQSEPRFRGAIVIHVCLPESFIRICGAFNVGYFFWETENLPTMRFWKAHLLKIDRLWAPSRWQSRSLRTLTGRDEVPVIPWPLNEAEFTPDSSFTSLAAVRVHRPMTEEELDNYLTRASPIGMRTLEKAREAAQHAEGLSCRFDPGRSEPFAQLLDRDGDLFVAVQTDAPRKGLPLLLASWFQFKATEDGRDAKLLIKLSSLDVTADLFRAHFHASLAVRAASRRSGLSEPDVLFIHDRLSASEVRALVRSADALVSATMGEGFGGPIAEALIERTPVIAPRHTAIQDILADTYPLKIVSQPHHLKLWNNIDIYSASSRWRLVDEASFVGCLRAFARMPGRERRAIVDVARARLLAHAGLPAVGEALRRELGQCGQAQPGRRGPDPMAPDRDLHPANTPGFAALRTN